MYARAPPIVKLSHLFYSAENPQLPGFEAENRGGKRQRNKMLGLIYTSKPPQKKKSCKMYSNKKYNNVKANFSQ